MKFLMKVGIPTVSGNKAMRNGNMLKQIQSYLKEVRPEAAYFSIECGKRTMFLIVDVPSAEKMPEIAEPLWLDFEAEVFVTPIMDVMEFEKAGPGIQRVLKERM